MRQTVFLAFGILLFIAQPLSAQPAMELTPFVGYTMGGGFDELGLPDAAVESVDIKDAASYGLIFDIGNRSGAFEVTWSHLESDLEGRGGAAEGVLLDYSSDNVQFGFIGYFAGTENSTWFYNAGLGFTSLDIANQESDSQFSVSLGGGYKHMFNDRLGLRLQARWIPTYVNSDDPYVICDPFFCYTVADDNYLYQTEVSAGLVIRLGR